MKFAAVARCCALAKKKSFQSYGALRVFIYPKIGSQLKNRTYMENNRLKKFTSYNRYIIHFKNLNSGDLKMYLHLRALPWHNIT